MQKDLLPWPPCIAVSPTLHPHTTIPKRKTLLIPEIPIIITPFVCMNLIGAFSQLNCAHPRGGGIGGGGQNVQTSSYKTNKY